MTDQPVTSQSVLTFYEGIPVLLGDFLVADGSGLIY
jgi:hypothetical protein